jgi:hypothetical protein
MKCYKCKTEIDINEKKISFHSTCDICGEDLHICKNCKYYSPGKPNDCIVPNTLPIKDRERYNFCEDFKPSSNNIETFKSKKEISKKLFNDQ